ncbi:hypothetical protein BC826DRAFT_1121204 [Russula brevipes]|nr:hypothetical protein BC826DRAFT_1121204 [Russula brevipes]
MNISPPVAEFSIRPARTLCPSGPSKGPGEKGGPPLPRPCWQDAEPIQEVPAFQTESLRRNSRRDVQFLVFRGGMAYWSTQPQGVMCHCGGDDPWSGRGPGFKPAYGQMGPSSQTIPNRDMVICHPGLVTLCRAPFPGLPLKGDKGLRKAGRSGNNHPTGHVDSIYPKKGMRTGGQTWQDRDSDTLRIRADGITEAMCWERERTPGLGALDQVPGRSRVG